MANEKISELTVLASAADADVFAVVDVDDKAVSTTGQTKKIRADALFSSGTSMPNLVEVGTITTGSWTGTTLGVGYGGTGLTTVTSGDILYADGTDSLAALGKGDDGKVLTLDSGIPAWGTVAGTGNVNNTGTPLDTQLAVWTDATTIKGDEGLTYNSTTDALTATTFIGALTGNASGSSGSCTGNAGTATALATARTIGGTSFNGTANIDIEAGELKATGITDGWVLTADGSGEADWEAAATSGGTVTSVTAGAGMTQTGTSTVNPTLDVSQCR